MLGSSYSTIQILMVHHCLLDNSNHGKDGNWLNSKRFLSLSSIVKYKTAFYSFYLPVALGMIVSGARLHLMYIWIYSFWRDMKDFSLLLYLATCTSLDNFYTQRSQLELTRLIRSIVFVRHQWRSHVLQGQRDPHHHGRVLPDPGWLFRWVDLDISRTFFS